MSAAVSAISVRVAVSARASSRAAIPSRIARWSGSALRRDRFGRRRELEGRPQDAAEHPAEMTQELVVARGEDPVVELEVGGEVRDLVVDALLHPRVGLRDRRDLASSARVAARRAASGSIAEPHLRRLLVQPVSFVASTRQLSTSGSRMFQSSPADAGAGLGPGLHEPLGREDAHGLAQDGAADGEIGGELVLGRQRVAGLQVAADDLQADRVDDLAVQAAPRIGERSSCAPLPHRRIVVTADGVGRRQRSIIIRYAFWDSDEPRGAAGRKA